MMATKSNKEPLLPVSSSNRGNMRGGPRMACSPYFTFTLIALLTFMTMRWWSLSGQKDELERRIRGLQNEIMLEQGNIKQLEDSLAQQKSSGDKLISERSSLQRDRDSLNEQINVLKNEKIRLAEEKAEAEGQADDFRNDLAACKERDVAATLTRNKQVEEANARAAELEKDLAACEKAAGGGTKGTGKGVAQKPDGASANMEGQLRDVKVSAVRVDDKAIGDPDDDGGNAGENKPQDENQAKETAVEGGMAGEEGSVNDANDNAEEEEEEVKISQDTGGGGGGDKQDKPPPGLERAIVKGNITQPAEDRVDEKQVIPPPDFELNEKDPVDPPVDDDDDQEGYKDRQGDEEEDNPALHRGV